MTQCGAAGIRALWMAVYIAAVFEQERQDRNAARRAYMREYSRRPEVRARKQAAEKTPEVRERRRASERRHREKHGYWTGDRPLDRSEGAGYIPPGGHVPDWVYRATLEHMEEHRIRMGLPSDATEEDRSPSAALSRQQRLAGWRRWHQRCERCAGRREGSSRCQVCERFVCDPCRGWVWPDRRRWLCADCVGLDAVPAAAVS